MHIFAVTWTKLGLFEWRWSTGSEAFSLLIGWSNYWLDQWQSGKLGTGSCVYSFPRAFPSSTDVPVLLLNQPNISWRLQIRNETTCPKMKTNHCQILQNVLFRLTCFAQLNVFPYYHRLLHLWRLLFNQNSALLNGCRAKTYAGVRPFFQVVDQSTSRAKKDSNIPSLPRESKISAKAPLPQGQHSPAWNW